MQDTGFVRKIDENGRVVLPMDIRKKMEISEGDSLKMYWDNDSLIIKKLHDNCIFCGGIENIQDFKEKKVCIKCIKSLSEKVE